MSIPSLLGPVTAGASFMFASLQNGVPFILNSISMTGGIVYYWESNLSTIAIDKHMGIFTTQGSLDRMTIHDFGNGGGINFLPNSTTITHAIDPAFVMMSQPSFANWPPPDLFLSAVPYTLFTATGATASIFTAIPGTGGTGPTIPANNLIILPVIWYFNCSNSGGKVTYDTIDIPVNSVINWFCVANASTTGCTGIEIAPNGWTNIADCSVGHQYSYCPTGDVCGNDNCNGPCPSSFDDCSFSNSQYVCTFDPNKVIPGNQWWQSPYFIGAVTAAVLLIIVFIILIYIVGRSR